MEKNKTKQKKNGAVYDLLGLKLGNFIIVYFVKTKRHFERPRMSECRGSDFFFF